MTTDATALTPVELPRWALILFGALSVITGILALVWPGITILVLVSLLGIQLLLYGIFRMVAAFQAGEGQVLAVLFGVLALLAGTALWLRPVRNVGAVLIVMAVFWVVGGIVQTIGAVVERDEYWVVRLVGGLLSLAAGVVAVVWPGITLFVIAINAGIWMILIGGLWLWAGFQSSESTPATA